MKTYELTNLNDAQASILVRIITDEIDMQEEWAKRAESREMQESADWHRKWGKMMEEVLNQLLDQGLKPYFKTY